LDENVYEGLFILNSNRYARDPAGVSGAVTALIEKQGGTVLVSRLWEERRLAYPISGQRKGTYWLTYFRVDGQKIPAINELANRQNDFLRHLLIRIEPRIVDTLVSHAQQSIVTEKPSTTKQNTGKPKAAESAEAGASVATAEAE
jgi:small subunit ribosomal protein S6